MNKQLNLIKLQKIEKSIWNYYNKYKDVISNANNQLTIGSSIDVDGNYYIVVYLANKNKIKELPTTFETFKVDIKIIGKTIAL